MTCLEKYMMENPGVSPEAIANDLCPGGSGGIEIKDPDYCEGNNRSGKCHLCWAREIPGTSATWAAANTLKVMLDDGAKMPTRAHKSDAGLDLYSRECMKLYPGESYEFDTGVHVAIPAGYVGMVKSKSGLNVNHGLTSEGVIDSGYTGSIVVKLYNHGKHSYLIERGQKISQLVILPCLLPDLEQVDCMEETDRGNGGFGSTGAF